MCSNKSKKLLFHGISQLDPTLAQLFGSSVKPVEFCKNQSPSKQRPTAVDEVDQKKLRIEDSRKLSSNYLIVNDKKNENCSHNNKIESQTRDIGSNGRKSVVSPHNDRKRKRKVKNYDDAVVAYMRKLPIEEGKGNKNLWSEKDINRPKSVISQDGSDMLKSDDSHLKESQEYRSNRYIVPTHESLNESSQNMEFEKASRTVFLANVSILAISSKTARKTLLAHMSSFLSKLPSPPDGTPAHKIESLRFRSTAYVGSGTPKRAAYAKKELMKATTKSTNAYLVYSNAYAAREAVKRLNGTIVLDRHLRVDGVSHPSKTDHRRCVFVGNLGFVDDESSLSNIDENVRKRSKIPADIEEGLWRQFSKAGEVESVRVIRDKNTRVGKGFAYVQFMDPNTVEAALLFNEKKYPPMLPRTLRVVRAKALKKTAAVLAALSAKKTKKTSATTHIFNPKLSTEQSSLHGRAPKLLGRAGAAKLKESDRGSVKNDLKIDQQRVDVKPEEKPNLCSRYKLRKMPESFVFEGQRASSKSSNPKISKSSTNNKFRESRLKTRSALRASEWKKTGTKKAKML